MSTYVGIVRSDLRLKRAWDRLDILYEETESLFKRSVASKEICELRNMINVGYLIMRQLWNARKAVDCITRSIIRTPSNKAITDTLISQITRILIAPSV